jgi:hypothetical protein
VVRTLDVTTAKGRVSVKVGKRTRTVKAGQSYWIKARLFGARRSRG